MLAVCEERGVTLAELTNEPAWRYVSARWEAMRRVRSLTFANGQPPSFERIGQWFGGYHHATVMYGLKRLRGEGRLRRSPASPVIGAGSRLDAG